MRYSKKPSAVRAIGDQIPCTEIPNHQLLVSVLTPNGERHDVFISRDANERGEWPFAKGYVWAYLDAI
jgi:hypothetical protein